MGMIIRDGCLIAKGVISGREKLRRYLVMANGSYRLIGVCSLLIAVIMGHLYTVNKEDKDLVDWLEKEKRNGEEQRTDSEEEFREEQWTNMYSEEEFRQAIEEECTEEECTEEKCTEEE
jgi:hypothetical protein